MAPASYNRDMSRYTHCQQKPHDMDLYSQYGPWPGLYDDWESYVAATKDVSRGTVAMEVTAKWTEDGVKIEFDQTKWQMKVKDEDRVVLSSTHPCLDHLVDTKVVDTSLDTYPGLLTLE